MATNALLERNGERSALVTTKGFKDLLHIGNQARPRIFDLEIKLQDVLYEAVVEVDEQVCRDAQKVNTAVFSMLRCSFSCIYRMAQLPGGHQDNSCALPDGF